MLSGQAHVYLGEWREIWGAGRHKYSQPPLGWELSSQESGAVQGGEGERQVYCFKPCSSIYLLFIPKRPLPWPAEILFSLRTLTRFPSSRALPFVCRKVVVASLLCTPTFIYHMQQFCFALMITAGDGESGHLSSLFCSSTDFE